MNPARKPRSYETFYSGWLGSWGQLNNTLGLHVTPASFMQQQSYYYAFTYYAFTWRGNSFSGNLFFVLIKHRAVAQLPRITYVFIPFIPSPSLTKESITQADGYRLGLSVVCKCGLAEFSSDTRLLVATEWDLVVQHVVLVNPDGTGTELVGDADGSVEVGGVDGSGETVGGGVTSLDDLFLSLELGD